MAREVAVHIVGDSRDVERAFARSSKAAQGFKATITGDLGFKNVGRQAAGFAGGYLAVGAAASAVGAGLASSIEAASSLNEQINRTNVVFEDSADEMLAWSRTSADAMGLARSEALAAAAGIAGIAQTSGLTEKASAEMGRQIVQLAADMASFNDEDPTEMLERLRSGIVGEAEPLRRFQVLLSEARVTQEAYASGIARAGSKLTEGQKVQARFNIIMQDTVKQQGDFAATADSFANQSRILRANVVDLSAAVGNQLLPVVTNLVTELNDGIESGRRFAGVLGDVARAAKDAVEDLPGEEEAAGPFRRAADELRKQATGRLGAAILGGTPGVGQVRTLIAMIDNATYAVGLFHDEASKPINFDFSAVAALTAGLQSAGLAAKDLIETGELGQNVPETRPPFTAEQRRKFFDADIARQLERVQDLPTLKAQIGRLGEIAARIRERIKKTQDITRRLELKDQLLRIQREIRAKQAQQHTNAEEAERKALAHQEEMARLAKERAEKARLARETAQFRLLGFGAGGGELIPGLQNLRRRLQTMKDTIRGTALDTRNVRNQIQQIGRVLSGEFGKVGEQVRSKIDEIFDSWSDELTQGRNNLITKFEPIDTKRFVAMLGINLSAAEQRRLRGALAGLGPGMTVPGSRTGAFAGAKGGVTINGGLNLYGVQNVQQMENELAKRSMARPQTRRGAR